MLIINQASAGGRYDGADTGLAEVVCRGPGGLRQRIRAAGNVGSATHSRGAANHHTRFHGALLAVSGADHYYDSFPHPDHHGNVLALSFRQLPQPGPHFGRRRSLQRRRPRRGARPPHAGRRLPLRVPGPEGRCLLHRRPRRVVLAVGIQGCGRALRGLLPAPGALTRLRFLALRLLEMPLAKGASGRANCSATGEREFESHSEGPPVEGRCWWDHRQENAGARVPRRGACRCRRALPPCAPFFQVIVPSEQVMRAGCVRRSPTRKR
jgi:hypothetical protein